MRLGADGGRARQPSRPWRLRLADWGAGLARLLRPGAAFKAPAHVGWRKTERETPLPAAAHSPAWRQFWRDSWRELRRYPTALLGAAMVLALILISLATMIFLPYERTVALWRREENAFLDNPRTAPPVWVNWFRQEKLPPTIVVDSLKQPDLKTVTDLSQGMSEILLTFEFDFNYDAFPQDIVIFMEPSYADKPPLVDFTWVRPDGKELRLGRFTVPTTNTAYYVTQDARVKNRFGDLPISESLFADDQPVEGTPMQGRYQLRITGVTFEEGSDFEARMVLYGRVHGLAGTDNMRRDLLLPLLWGAPVALAFGLLGAVVTTLISMLIAALGVWFGGWVDDAIQRLSEVNLILPALPIAIMVFIMYSKSIWAILAVIVALNIFGNGIKVYRAAFLQIRSAPYIEAAQAYGASSWRIIMRYLTPRVLPVLAPQLVIMVPGYVFYEATLAYLGISDPYLPTWGKMIYDALAAGGFRGNYYWSMQPIGLLLLTGLAFAMLGFALDRILNPRLREQ